MNRDASSMDLSPIFSLVPFAQPIVLHSYYPSFADYYGEAELQTKRWFVQNATSDWVFADIGANVGMYTLLLSRLAPNGHVHAFEPTETVEMLRANVKASEAGNVSVHNIALGAVEGEQEESIYRIWGEAPETKRYRFNTLDGFVRDAGVTRLDCVKIDVDGFDLEVLKGSVETLARFNPWIVIELNHALATRGQSAGEALLWLVGQGYDEAFVVDHENFVLKRTNNRSANKHGLRLRFDRDPILLPPSFATDEPVSNLFQSRPTFANEAREEQGIVVVPGPCWSYAATWPIVEAGTPDGPVIVEMALEVLSGRVGIGCLMADMATYIGKEAALSAAPPLQTARIFLRDTAKVRHLVLRNTETSGRESRVRVHSVRTWRAIPASTKPSRVLEPGVRSFDLGQLVGESPRAHREIAITPVSELDEILGFAEPYVPDRMLYRYGLRDFDTQIDEAGLYRYLYRQFRPARHLEFGTWEGFGVVLCAESCDAEIWTVNLPDGEHSATGSPVYPSLPTGGASDAGDRIGWRYRSAGFGPRVHQMLLDSRDFPISEFRSGFFDTALVDGGHAPDVVANDSNMALHLVRSGGMIIWHDFCPEPEAIMANEAVQGVVQAWMANYDEWRPQLARLFWLRPSWLLIGVKR